MNIVVFGASGATGSQVIASALSGGHTVTAFSRTAPKDMPPGASLRIVRGNVADAAAVADAIAGQDAVISTLGVGKPLRHDQAVIDGVGHVLSAMHASGVRRFLYLSFTGVKDVRGVPGLIIRPIVGFILRHEIADHVEKEALIRASDADWTIVQAPKLTNGPATTTYRSGPAITSAAGFPTISRADVAGFMVAQVTDQRFVRQVVRILP